MKVFSDNWTTTPPNFSTSITNINTFLLTFISLSQCFHLLMLNEHCSFSASCESGVYDNSLWNLLLFLLTSRLATSFWCSQTTRLSAASRRTEALSMSCHLSRRCFWYKFFEDIFSEQTLARSLMWPTCIKYENGLVNDITMDPHTIKGHFFSTKHNCSLAKLKPFPMKTSCTNSYSGHIVLRPWG